MLYALLALAVSDRALACACCTERGYRNVNVVSLHTGRRDEIEQLHFGREAQLYVGAGGLEAVDGIYHPFERYRIHVAWEKHRVVFSLRDPRGVSSTLAIAIPSKMTIFEVDPRDGPDHGHGPVLYKEWKMTGKAGGSGAFGAANGPNQLLTLILQGRGNACTSSNDFSHWTLVMQGPKAHYILFGDLVRH